MLFFKNHVREINAVSFLKNNIHLGRMIKILSNSFELDNIQLVILEVYFITNWILFSLNEMERIDPNSPRIRRTPNILQ
jgi:hypothetical protein